MHKRTDTAELVRIEHVKIGTFTLRPVDEKHVKCLAAVIDALPPIEVQRCSMMLVDGLHRLTVFRRAKRAVVPVTWFDGDYESAVVRAIEVNVMHGRPLSLRERRLAAMRLVRECPERSDRSIAAVCGLDHKTVGALRASGKPSRPEYRPVKNSERPAPNSKSGASFSMQSNGGNVGLCVTDSDQLASFLTMHPLPHVDDAAFGELSSQERCCLAERALEQESWWRAVGGRLRTNNSESEIAPVV